MYDRWDKNTVRIGEIEVCARDYKYDTPQLRHVEKISSYSLRLKKALQMKTMG